MRTEDGAIESAAALMAGFAERTGLGGAEHERRYLWTDAFAVCNFLEIGRRTSDVRQRERALWLVDRVHYVLGRHRADDARQGWISALGEAAGLAHPTRGGLRIGKALPERRAGEPFDERLEWERDGQYFHYLTQWMHALDQVARATRQPRFNAWGRELLAAAHAAFTQASGRGGARRMFWKMSTDLSRPLVASMGQHDPLSGFVACLELETTAAELAADPGPDLGGARADFAAMLEAGEMRTTDPLGLGGLLADAYRVARLASRGAFDGERLLERLVAAALEGCAHYVRQEDWRHPAAHRLAFRELGLAIGLAALAPLRKEVEGRHGRTLGGGELRARLGALERAAPLGTELVSFWLGAESRRAQSWSEHLDINEVMLATALVPEGYLLPAPSQ